MRRGSFRIKGVEFLNVSILPRLATGIELAALSSDVFAFLFFPVLRRGSVPRQPVYCSLVSILPRLATGIRDRHGREHFLCFYSSPSCDGDPSVPSVESVDGEFLFFPVLRRGSMCSCTRLRRDVSILPRLATGIGFILLLLQFVMFLFFPVLRRGDRKSTRLNSSH